GQAPAARQGRRRRDGGIHAGGARRRDRHRPPADAGLLRRAARILSLRGPAPGRTPPRDAIIGAPEGPFPVLDRAHPRRRGMTAAPAPVQWPALSPRLACRCAFPASTCTPARKPPPTPRSSATS